MFDFLFTLTSAYMAYVAYDAYQAVQRSKRGEPVIKLANSVSIPKPVSAPAAVATTPTKVSPAQPAVTAKPTAKPAEVKLASAAATPSASKTSTPKATPAKPASAQTVTELKNPATGEISPVPANYRFAKKWIKDALVSEKLLDRVYKPNELDDKNSAKVKEAIEKLSEIKKYQA